MVASNLPDSLDVAGYEREDGRRRQGNEPQQQRVFHRVLPVLVFPETAEYVLGFSHRLNLLRICDRFAHSASLFERRVLLKRNGCLAEARRGREHFQSLLLCASAIGYCAALAAFERWLLAICQMVLMLLVTNGKMAAAARATNPSNSVYSIVSCPSSPRQKFLARNLKFVIIASPKNSTPAVCSASTRRLFVLLLGGSTAPAGLYRARRPPIGPAHLRHVQKQQRSRRRRRLSTGATPSRPPPSRNPPAAPRSRPRIAGKCFPRCGAR